MAINRVIRRDLIVDDFRDTRQNLPHKLADELDYAISIRLLPNLEAPFEAVQSITLKRILKSKDESFAEKRWTYKRTATPLKEQHFKETEFDYATENKGNSLSILCALALKAKYDELHGSKRGGLLFRSELYALRNANIWRQKQADLDKLVSDSIIRAVNPDDPNRGRYPRLPLLRKFLIAANEIWNIVCWAGSDHINEERGTASEKIWVLNVSPQNIRIMTADGIELAGNPLRATLKYFFPEEFVLSEATIAEYEKRIKAGERPEFELPRHPAYATQPKKDSEGTLELWENLRKHAQPHTPEMIDFSHIFESHPSSQFVGRERIFAQIDQFLGSPAQPSPYLLVVGEPGIGKTALIANYIQCHRPEAVRYFIQRSKQNLDKPDRFLRHLYVSLSARYNLPVEATTEPAEVISERLKRRAREIRDTQLEEGDVVAIFVDGLDEAVVDARSATGFASFLELDLPERFRIVITSNEVPDLIRFRLPDASNVIYLVGANADSQSDVRHFLEHNLLPWTEDPLITDQLTLSSGGNFLYAKLVIDALLRKLVTVNQLVADPPQGLVGIHELRLHRALEALPAHEDREIALSILRLVALLQEPHSAPFLFDYLDLDYVEGNRIAAHIERFLDLHALHEHGVLRFFHNSFREYLTDPTRLSDNETRRLHQAVVTILQQQLNKPELAPPYTLDYAIHHAYLARDYETLFLLAESVLQHKLRNLHHGETLPDLFTCLSAACEVKDLRQIAFFSLMFWVVFTVTFRYDQALESRPLPKSFNNSYPALAMRETLEAFAIQLGFTDASRNSSECWTFGREASDSHSHATWIVNPEVAPFAAPTMLRLTIGDSPAALLQRAAYYAKLPGLIPRLIGLIAQVSAQHAWTLTIGVRLTGSELLDSFIAIMASPAYEPCLYDAIQASVEELTDREFPRMTEARRWLALRGYSSGKTSWRAHLDQIGSPLEQCLVAVEIAQKALETDMGLAVSMLEYAMAHLSTIFLDYGINDQVDAFRSVWGVLQRVPGQTGFDSETRRLALNELIPYAHELSSDLMNCGWALNLALNLIETDRKSAIELYYKLSLEHRGQFQYAWEETVRGTPIDDSSFEGRRYYEFTDAELAQVPGIAIRSDSRRECAIRDCGDSFRLETLRRFANKMIAPTRTANRNISQLLAECVPIEELRQQIDENMALPRELVFRLVVLVRRLKNSGRKQDQELCRQLARDVLTHVKGLGEVLDEDLTGLVHTLSDVDFQLAESMLDHMSRPRYRADALLFLLRSDLVPNLETVERLLQECCSIAWYLTPYFDSRGTIESRLAEFIGDNIGEEFIPPHMIEKCLLDWDYCAILLLSLPIDYMRDRLADVGVFLNDTFRTRN